MRSLLKLVILGVCIFLALGYYLDWYSFSNTSAEAGHVGIQMDLNKKKIGDDVNHGVEAGSKKVHELIDGNKSEPKK